MFGTEIELELSDGRTCDLEIELRLIVRTTRLYAVLRLEQYESILRRQRLAEILDVFEGAGLRCLGVRRISGTSSSGGYSCHFQASLMRFHTFSWLLLALLNASVIFEAPLRKKGGHARIDN